MVHEFSRSEPLFGAAAMDKLAASTVVVFGVGGVGSHCIEALARGSVGRLVLIDSDTVAITNINRQSIAYHSTVGRYKTHVMKERILDINPQAKVLTFEEFVLPDNLETLLGTLPWTIDYIVDAIDTVAAKLAIALYATERKLPLISAMGTGNKLHPEQFEITDLSRTSVCPLCKVMRRELKKKGIEHLTVLYSREKPKKFATEWEEPTAKRTIPASVSFVPPVAGLLMAGEVLRNLAGMTEP